MNDLARLLVLLAIVGSGVTLLGGVVLWYRDESRSIRRGLRIILQGDTHGILVARGRGRGLGFNFESNRVAVTWDNGAWGLLYQLDELNGAEVIVDGRVVARVHRGEARRPLDSFSAAEERVALRLAFNDAFKPDFVLDLWLPEDEGRRDALPAEDAVEEANRWIGRIEALLRRATGVRRASPAVAPPQDRQPVQHAATAASDDEFDEIDESIDADEAII